jgi:hypothetical protein
MEFIKWLVTSSSNRQKYSSMVKGALGLGVAWLIQLSPFFCGAHIVCVEPQLLDSIVDTIGTIVYLGLSLVSAIAFLFGLGRKIWLNRISAYTLPPADLPSA